MRRIEAREIKKHASDKNWSKTVVPNTADLLSWTVFPVGLEDSIPKHAQAITLMRTEMKEKMAHICGSEGIAHGYQFIILTTITGEYANKLNLLCGEDVIEDFFCKSEFVHNMNQTAVHNTAMIDTFVKDQLGPDAKPADLFAKGSNI